ncbi:hypothetical protein KBD75_01050 [Candidatus Woesebacteria bacterium]|nr:hypothetical protein [Candidatus Woesebacteria bacterium]
MIRLSDIGEILFKPSLEAVSKDITSWGDTLLKISDAVNELGFSADESELFKLRLRQRLATKIAGTLPTNHRDRPSLDEVSQLYREKAERMQEADSGTMKHALVDRAANMITSAYISEDDEGGNDGLKKIKLAVQMVKQTS